MQTVHQNETQRHAPTPATVQAVLARFRAGMREQGDGDQARLAAHFRCSWHEAARLLAGAMHPREGR